MFALLAHMGIGAAIGSFLTHALHLKAAQAKGVDKVLHLKAGTSQAIDNAIVPVVAQKAADATDAETVKVAETGKL